MQTLNSAGLIPLLICLKEGGQFHRVKTSPYNFEKWRIAKHEILPPTLRIYAWFGWYPLTVPIVVNMNGFVYDKICELHTGRLLRNNRKTFDWDINESPNWG